MTQYAPDGFRTALRRLPGAYWAHYATLLVAVPVLFYIARSQWFFFDEWAFLTPANDGGLWAGHNGHWSTVPILATWAIRALVGVNVFWPFLAVTFVTHLVFAHLLWRIMIRSGATPWIATSLAALFVFLGAGSENILWEFQAGFIGAAMFATAAFLLVMHDRLRVRETVGIAVLLLLALASSGTAVPVAVLAGVLSLRRHGFRRTALAFGAPAIIYAVWLVINRGSSPQTADFAASGAIDFLVGIPQYIGDMFVEGIGVVLPVSILGAFVVFAVLVWTIVTARVAVSRDGMAPYALLLAALLFAALTAYTRLALGTATASSSRYVYLVFALMLPVLAIAISRLARRSSASLVVACILIAVVMVYNGGLLVSAARTQAQTEQNSRGQLYAALDIALTHPERLAPNSSPDRANAPDLTTDALLDMHDRGWISVGDYSRVEYLDALMQLSIAIAPAQTVGSACTEVTTGAYTLATDSTATIETPIDTGYTAEVRAHGLRSAPLQQTAMKHQPVAIENLTGRNLYIGALPTGTEVCT